MNEECKTYLENISNLIGEKKGFVYNSIEQFLLKKGTGYSSCQLPDNVVFGTIKMCFHNAFKLAERNGYRYVEGYAMSVIPMIHAWCVDEYDTVVDPTWRKVGSWYHGVELDLDYVRHIQLLTEQYGTLDCWSIQFPLLTGKHIYEINGQVKGWANV